MSNYIYISAIDVISPINNGYDEFVKKLYSENIENLEKKSIDLAPMRKPYIKYVRRMNRASVLAFISSTQAFLQRGLDKIDYNSYDIGTIFSVFSPSLDSSLSILKTLYDNGIDLVSPIMFSSTVGNSCISGVAMRYKLKGQSIMVKSSNSLNYSQVLLKNGKAEMLLCGGYDAYLPEMLKFYDSEPYVSSEYEKSIPYSEETKGIYLKESAVTLILESSNSPYLEMDKVYCEVCNTSVVRKSGNNENAIKYFRKEDFIEVMSNVLSESGVPVEDVDAIFSAAGGHQTLDKSEAEAISNIFGKSTVVTSIKGIFGDSLGANILLNTAAAAVALKENKLPSSYRCGDGYGIININKKILEKNFKYILVNGYSELGDIISVLLKKV